MNHSFPLYKTIEKKLKSNDTEKISRGVHQLYKSWCHGIHLINIRFPFSILTVYQKEIPADVLEELIIMMISADNFLYLKQEDIPREITKIICNYTNNPGAITIAKELQEKHRSETLISNIITQVGEFIDDSYLDNFQAVKAFLSQLLQGSSSVRQTTIKSMSQWQHQAIHEKILYEITHELTDDEKTQLENNITDSLYLDGERQEAKNP